MSKEVSEGFSKKNNSKNEVNDENPSVQEITILENMTSFLETNCKPDIDQKVLRSVAEALTKCVHENSSETFHDDTMENIYGIGYRSCQGTVNSSNAVPGRSLREIEEQMSSLRKENFNLKLRLYFIEESIPGYNHHHNSSDGNEVLLKQIIDLKVEAEVLRKEVQEKQDLLKEAGQVIDYMEKMQKESEVKAEEAFSELNSKIQNLEMEREIEKSKEIVLSEIAEVRSDDATEQYFSDKVMGLEEALQKSEEKLVDFQSQINKLDAILCQRDITIEDLDARIKQIAAYNTELAKSIEEKNTNMLNIQPSKEFLAQKAELADKICMLQDAEEELSKQKKMHEKNCRTIQKLMLHIKSQQEEINRLKNKTNDSMKSETLNVDEKFDQSKDADCGKLCRKLQDLIQNTTIESNNDEANAQNNVENSDGWRRECAHLCTVLLNRLEELAGFLHSLLNHKDVLGILAVDRRRAIRKAVNHSLDLSKSLNMTLSISGASIVEPNLLQLTNLSGILNDHEELINGSYNSHKVVNKSTEFDERRRVDMKRSQNLLENQIESDAWSEPDRNVSLARIGLETSSASISREIPHRPESDSESDFHSHNQNRLIKSRSQEKILQLEQLIWERDQRILQIQCQLVEADNLLKKEKLHVIELLNELKVDQQNRYSNGNSDIQNKNVDNQLFLENQITEKSNEFEKLQNERDYFAEEASQAEMRLNIMNSDIEEMKKQQKNILKCVIEEEKQKLEKLKGEMELRNAQKLHDQAEKHNDILSRDWISRDLYENLQREFSESQRLLLDLTDQIEIMKCTLIESEMNIRDLRKQLDESTLQASKAVLERSKAQNENLNLQKKIDEMIQKLNLLESERNSLQNELTQQQYLVTMMMKKDIVEKYTTSDSKENICSNKNHVQGKDNISLDLGIENNGNRISNTEEQNMVHSSIKDGSLKIEPQNISDASSFANKSNQKIIQGDKSTQNDASNTNIQHDCNKIEQENADLRRKLIRTKRAFEDTYEKLRIANQKKTQIEKDIKNQILKTQNVLKNVRTNMENEL